MIVIQIIPDCRGEPIRLVCFNGGLLSNTIGVIVSNDEPLPESTCYELHVGCGEANVDRILDIASFQDLSDGQPRSKTLTENREALCVHGKSCTLARLTLEEILIPLVIDELNPNQRLEMSHGNYQ